MSSIRTLFCIPLALAVTLVGCETAENNDEVIGLDELGLTIDEAIDDIDDEAGDGSSVVESLDMRDAATEITPDEIGRRARIKQLLREMAEDEECAIRGVLGGRYSRADLATDPMEEGSFNGRAYRRNRRLVAVSHGSWNSAGPEAGGSFLGRYMDFEEQIGALRGHYSPVGSAEAPQFGTFQGRWSPSVVETSDEAPVVVVGRNGGHLSGIWHPLSDGETGLFIGFWSRCDLRPTHDREPGDRPVDPTDNDTTVEVD